MGLDKKSVLIVIGSGPGGYVAALYASRRGMRTCVIEKGLVGGACLNRGCIPTKSLLKTASIASSVKEAPLFGVNVAAFEIDFAKAMSRKDEVTNRLRAGIETLFKTSGVELVRGAARIVGPNTVEVDGSARLDAKNIIIAAGSEAARLAGIDIDESSVLSSDGILNIKEAPARLAIIGGGVIGCEFATLFDALGSKVFLIEMTDRLMPGQSREISKKLELIFKKRGIEVFTSAKVENIDRIAGSKTSRLRFSNGKVLEAEKVLVAVGRQPATEGLGDLGRFGVRRDKGRIVVDEYMRTGARAVYAIGDCVGGPLLAHKASYEGMLACDNILGERRKADHSNIPNCVWTEPEIASVGLNEEEARSKYPDAKIAKFPYLGSGKAFLLGKAEGFIKIIGDARGAILGVEIFGEGACELIGEAVLAKTARVNIKDWARVVHGHPTLSEIVQEAAHVFCGTAIHGM